MKNLNFKTCSNVEVPYSEFAMALKIAGKGIVAYAVHGNCNQCATIQIDAISAAKIRMEKL